MGLGAGTLMRLLPKRKVASPSDRRAKLRKARAEAPTLRAACPDAALVRVELTFQEEVGSVHPTQAFSIFPPARAHFVYACPFGSCDGLYDLNEIAFEALRAGKRQAEGVLVCIGHRSRKGNTDYPCELKAVYSISVRRDNEAFTPSRGSGAQA